MKRILLALWLMTALKGFSQVSLNPELLSKTWPAFWISAANAEPKGYAICYFRKSIMVNGTVDKYIVHISADNRYKFYVNDSLVSLGPARSDLNYWNFHTIDLAPYLKNGSNQLAALVWNEGATRPEGQISNQTGFLIQGDSEKEQQVNSNKSWKASLSSAYQPIPGIGYSAYYVSGAGEAIHFAEVPLNWTSGNFNDSEWPEARQLGWRGASPKGVGDITDWMLVPAALPEMERSYQRFASVRLSSSVNIPDGFPLNKKPVIIPANTKAEFLLDQGHLTNAYPVIRFAKGKGTRMEIMYAESLFDEVPNARGKTIHKGNRNEVKGKEMAGRRDSLYFSGTTDQFTTLNYRSFRYVQVTIETRSEPLEINDIYSIFTGFPFERKAVLNSPDSSLQTIFDIGWRTARLCAGETYMDCPYYEQLQYIGDARIQGLVSLFNSGDDRLLRNALNQMDHSRMAEGITLSRHPSYSPQQIPTFSLWYIGMLNDYWMYRGDSNYVRLKLQGMRDILWFFQQYQQPDGRIKNAPYWLFTDWVNGDDGWPGGTAPPGTDGCSAVLDLQLLWALQLAAKLEKELGMPAMAEEYQQRAGLLQKSIQKNYWDGKQKMYADDIDKKRYSQHANTLAILTGTISGKPAQDLGSRLLTNTSLSPASIYFKFYLHQALIKAGFGNSYLQWLDIWRENIKMGLTTWAEILEIDRARSDCHAWGSSPNIEFFRTVLGIDSDAPGFKKVLITPHLGALTSIGGSIPHPDGTVEASYQLNKNRWKILIRLPQNITGKLVWKDRDYPLKAGENSFDLAD